MSENQIKTSVRLLYVLFAGMVLVLLWENAGRGFDGVLGSLFCIFLVYFAYEKRSRVSAGIIFIGSFVALMISVPGFLGYDLGLEESLSRTHSYEAAVILFLLTLVSIIPAYLLTKWTIEFHKLNKSKTNWNHALKLTVGIFFYSFVSVIFLNIILDLDPDAPTTPTELVLLYLVIMAGMCRKLPGTKKYKTVIFE